MSTTFTPGQKVTFTSVGRGGISAPQTGTYVGVAGGRGNRSEVRTEDGAIKRPFTIHIQAA